MTNDLFPNLDILQDVQILVVDNDVDSRDLCLLLFESYGAKVKTIGSIKDALALLNGFVPDILICEVRFLNESVYPLIEHIRHIARSSGRAIPILVTSTCGLKSLSQYLTIKVEAYLIKPIDIDSFVDQVWHLMLPSNVLDFLTCQDLEAESAFSNASGQTSLAS